MDMASHNRSWLSGVAIGLGVTALGVMAFSSGLMDSLDVSSLDMHFRFSPARAADDRIVLIDIDDASLDAVLEARKLESAEKSYVASLYAKGIDHILKKVGEEAMELVVAAKGTDRTRVISEAADVGFHVLVLLHHLGLDSADVLAELERRFGLPGHEEKASR